jgi:antitoxin YefM
MSADDYDSWQETVYLLRSPENARRLMQAVARDKAGDSGLSRSIDELREMSGGEE